jgi:pSer/pThr/pTyr-binding forkhead associated (FHA) protein
VLAQGLAKRPDRRYDSCGDFADALREALGLEPYDPRRAPKPGRATAAAPVPPPPPAPKQAASTKTKTLTIPPDFPTPRAPEKSLPGQSVPEHSLPEKTAPEKTAPEPSGPSPSAPSPSAGGTWTAVVTADRAYYDHVRAADAADAATMTFPVYVPERRFPLAGTEVRIGRRSSKSPRQPDIDLTGPPADPGISRQHAELRRAPDGTWSVIDLDSDNGIQVNGKDVPSGTAVPVQLGDQIHLGAWTLITITPAAP